jgi:hypothetical protein
MRVVSEQQLQRALGALQAPEPRVVAGGNLATPRTPLLDGKTVGPGSPAVSPR